MDRLIQTVRRRLMERGASLSEPDLGIVTLRYGFTDGAVHTLEETAYLLGITRQRVRIAERRVLYPLVQAKRRVPIRDFYKNS